MKTIVAGSRSITNAALVERAILSAPFQITELISGGAVGVDRLAENWARQQSIPIVQFPPDWRRLGRRAGLIRNVEMAGYAEACIAIWDGISRGTAHMIRTARTRGLLLHVVETSAEATPVAEAG